ncbi:unnamed protein product [Enterobius vermicularis]|uniref:POPLD domain-containing protein n=1 Tax=Enterobius vermicularis TaxID=51028 RepID=A0A0N4V7M9_ENTVE|nr:unnamed protein product [Enterobius vermicularis]
MHNLYSITNLQPILVKLNGKRRSIISVPRASLVDIQLGGVLKVFAFVSHDFICIGIGRYDDADAFKVEPVLFDGKSRIVRPYLLWKRSSPSDDVSNFWKREVNRDKLVGFQKALQFGKRSRMKPYEFVDY